MARKLVSADQRALERQLKVQKALFEIADAATAVKSIDAFYNKLHRIVGKLMYAKSFYVILYDKEKVDADALHYILAESDLPKLYIPKKDNLIAVDQIPHLGSGKLDMMKLRQIATEAMDKKQTTEDTE